jgi:hypothetical protein
MEHARVLTARRAYEFEPDDLRLSVLSAPQAQQQIGQLFNFQVVQIGTPMPTFGPIPATIPPGAVFNYGGALTSEGEVPIRFLHIEPNRIVLDVAGGVSAIEQVYDQLQEALSQIHDLDGSPVVGKPISQSDYSEISKKMRFDAEKLLIEPLRRLVQETFSEKEDLRVAPATINFIVVGSAQPLKDLSQGPSLQVRAGTRLEDRVFLSTAFLNADEHIAWLEALDAELGSE